MNHQSKSIKHYFVAGLIGAVITSAGYIFVAGMLGELSYPHVSLVFVLRQAMIYLMPTTFAAAFIGAIMFNVQAHMRKDDECRCRKCGYILKRISKPECPECGEVI